MSRGKIAFEQGPCGFVSLERYTATHVFALAVSSSCVLLLLSFFYVRSETNEGARARASLPSAI